MAVSPAVAETTDALASSSASPRRDDPRDAPVRLVSGKPFWAANRTRTAEENAAKQRAEADAAIKAAEATKRAATKSVDASKKAVHAAMRRDSEPLAWLRRQWVDPALVRANG